MSPGPAKDAQAGATLYSLIETANANGLIHFDYLATLLEELPIEQIRNRGAEDEAAVGIMILKRQCYGIHV